MIIYHTLQNNEYTLQRWQMLVTTEENNVPKTQVYFDSVGIPTIGVGFNLRVDLVRDDVFVALGIGDNEVEETYKTRLIAAIAVATSAAALQTALDVIMAERFADVNVPGGETKRQSFSFRDVPHIRTTFDTIIDRMETDFTAALNIIAPDSRERLALLSLYYNHPRLIGAGLRAALLSGDRAEIWFEIRFNSNGGASRALGIAKRRALESELFGLYNNDDGNRVENSISFTNEEEALAVFRMYNKHETKIKAEETAFPTAVSIANNDYTYENFETFVTTRTLEASFVSAKKYLSAKYLSFDEGRLSGTNEGLSAWGRGEETLRKSMEETKKIIEKLDKYFGVSVDVSALDKLLGAKKSLDATDTQVKIFVASTTRSQVGRPTDENPALRIDDVREIAARTVDRTTHETTNFPATDDLIFGTLGDDTLKAGKGDDHILGSLGKDTIDGGDGNDTVSYVHSISGVSVTLNGVDGIGGFAEGDKISNVENIIGSIFADTLTGDDNNNIMIGLNGKDMGIYIMAA